MINEPFGLDFDLSLGDMVNAPRRETKHLRFAVALVREPMTLRCS